VAFFSGRVEGRLNSRPKRGTGELQHCVAAKASIHFEINPLNASRRHGQANGELQSATSRVSRARMVIHDIRIDSELTSLSRRDPKPALTHAEAALASQWRGNSKDLSTTGFRPVRLAVSLSQGCARCRNTSSWRVRQRQTATREPRPWPRRPPILRPWSRPLARVQRSRPLISS
jgi:hypothetical protein